MLQLAAVLGALAVAAGALAAHALKQRIGAEQLGWWDTAAQYQMVHALAMALCALFADNGRRTVAAAWCFGLGVLVFCGTLYAMALGGPRWLGAITPIGGVLFIVGWLVLACARPAAARP